MSRLRRISGREAAARLGKFGFMIVSIRGSHAKLRRLGPNGEKQTLTLPLHRELSEGTLKTIPRQASRYIASEALEKEFTLGDDKRT